MNLKNVIVNEGGHIEICGKRVVKCSRAIGQLQQRIYCGFKRTGAAVQRSKRTHQIHLVFVPTKIVFDELFVGLFSCTVYAPVFSVQIDFHWAPARRHHIGFERQFPIKRILKFVFPRRLSAIAQVQVAEGFDVWLGCKNCMFHGASVAVLKIQTKGALRLCSRPTAVNLEVKTAFCCGLQITVEPSQPTLS